MCQRLFSWLFCFFFFLLFLFRVLLSPSQNVLIKNAIKTPSAVPFRHNRGFTSDSSLVGPEIISRVVVPDISRNSVQFSPRKWHTIGITPFSRIRIRDVSRGSGRVNSATGNSPALVRRLFEHSTKSYFLLYAVTDRIADYFDTEQILLKKIRRNSVKRGPLSGSVPAYITTRVGRDTQIRVVW